MFSIFSGYGGRYGGGYGYGYGAPDSDEEEEVSAPFQLRRSGEGEGEDGNEKLAAALDDEHSSASPIIPLETNDDGADGHATTLDEAVHAAQVHMCVECRDQPAELICQGCDRDIYCEVCFSALHRTGSRRKHETTKYVRSDENGSANGSNGSAVAAASSAASASSSAAAACAMDESPAPVASSSTSSATAADMQHDGDDTKHDSENGGSEDITDEMFEDAFHKNRRNNGVATTTSAAAHAASSPTGALSSSDDDDDDSNNDDDSDSSSSSSARRSRITLSGRTMHSLVPSASGGGGKSVPRSINGQVPQGYYLERSKYIPLRLTMEERKFLRLLEATLNVSEYTDKIDIISSKAKVQRIKEQLRDICSILSGLVVSNDYKFGSKLIKDKNFEDNAEFFSKYFRIRSST